MTDLFKEKAQDWDVNEMVQALSSGIGAALKANVVFNDTQWVMDFGAGTGLITAQIAHMVKQVTAVDVSQAMLDKLMAKADLHGKVEAVCQNILEQPLGTCFELIVSAMAMHHVADTDKLLARFAEHLKSGGKIALADLDEEDGSFHPAEAEGVYHAGFNREAFRSLLSRHNFIDIRFVTAHTVVKGEKSYPVFLVLATLA